MKELEIKAAKQKLIHEVKKTYEPGTLFSYPNPYMLACDKTTGERLNNEPYFFRGYPTKRDVKALSESWVGTPHTIVAVYDLHYGTRESRLDGEMDMPTGESAEVTLQC